MDRALFPRPSPPAPLPEGRGGGRGRSCWTLGSSARSRRGFGAYSVASRGEAQAVIAARNYRDATTRVREAFTVALPEGLELVQADRQWNFRLNPAVAGRLEWEGLEAHPDAAVQRVVAEWRSGGRGRGRRGLAGLGRDRRSCASR